MPVLMIVVIIGALALYFLPAIIAESRHARHSGGIIMLDFLLGWTVVGWLGALIWACTDEVAADPARYPCPFCAEPILRAAKVCPHCRSELPATPVLPVMADPLAPASAPGIEKFSAAQYAGMAATAILVLTIGVLLARLMGPSSPPPDTPVVTVSSPAQDGYGPPPQRVYQEDCEGEGKSGNALIRCHNLNLIRRGAEE